ncbi:MAG: glycosyltransferase [Cyanobacteria bacterium J06632_22]
MTSFKVCITTREFPLQMSGLSTSAARIARLLHTVNYEVHVAVCRTRLHPIENSHCLSRKTTEQEGIVIHHLAPTNWGQKDDVTDNHSEIYSDIYFQLRQLHAQYQFDLFHAVCINETGFLTTLLAKEENIPVINSVSCSDWYPQVFSPQQFSQIIWTLDSSDWVTFVSRDLQKRAQIMVPSLAYRSSTFLPSIQPVNFAALPPPAHRLQGFVVGAMGHFQSKEGLEYLLEACTELLPKMALTLLLVGDFAEPERAYWETAIAASGMAAHTVVTGVLPRDEALAYLQYMDVYAIPSRHEGCSNALLAAMLSGRAIIGSKVDAIGEILKDRENGLLVPPGSSQAIKDAISTLAASSELRQILGRNAQATVYQHLSPTIERTHWAVVYRQLLSMTAPLTAAV